MFHLRLRFLLFLRSCWGLVFYLNIFIRKSILLTETIRLSGLIIYCLLLLWFSLRNANIYRSRYHSGFISIFLRHLLFKSAFIKLLSLNFFCLCSKGSLFLLNLSHWLSSVSRYLFGFERIIDWMRGFTTFLMFPHFVDY